MWSNAEVDSAINLAQKYITTVLYPNYLNTLIQASSGTTASATAYYDLPSDFVYIVGNPVVNSNLYIAFITQFRATTTNVGTLKYK